MTTPGLIANRIARGWTPERALTTPAMPPGRQPVAEQRPNIYARAGIFEANIRGENASRIYLGRYLTSQQAEEACRHYIATGIKPGRQRRKDAGAGRTRYRMTKSPHPPQTQPSPPDRIAMMRQILRRIG